jgi:hypothetical protein
MVEWLIPVSLFWTLVALYMGGLSTSIENGPAARQVLGLFATFLLFLLVWWAIRTGLGMVSEGLLTRVLLPTVLALGALPLVVRAGFRILGIRVARGGAPAH